MSSSGNLSPERNASIVDILENDASQKEVDRLKKANDLLQARYTEQSGLLDSLTKKNAEISELYNSALQRESELSKEKRKLLSNASRSPPQSPQRTDSYRLLDDTRHLLAIRDRSLAEAERTIEDLLKENRRLRLEFVQYEKKSANFEAQQSTSLDEVTELESDIQELRESLIKANADLLRTQFDRDRLASELEKQSSPCYSKDSEALKALFDDALQALVAEKVANDLLQEVAINSPAEILKQTNETLSSLREEIVNSHKEVVNAEKNLMQNRVQLLNSSDSVARLESEVQTLLGELAKSREETSSSKLENVVLNTLNDKLVSSVQRNEEEKRQLEQANWMLEFQNNQV